MIHAARHLPLAYLLANASVSYRQVNLWPDPCVHVFVEESFHEKFSCRV